MNEFYSQNPDIVVLGAGIVGLTLSLKLQNFDKKVLLIDKSNVGASTSYGNAGLIETTSVFPYAFPRDLKTLTKYIFQKSNASYYHTNSIPYLLPWLFKYWQNSSKNLYESAIERSLPLIINSWKEHIPLIKEAGANHLVNEFGWIKIWRNQQFSNLIITEAKNKQKYGINSSILFSEELNKIQPNIGNEIKGGVHYPNSRQIKDPFEFSNLYLKLFLKRGGMFVNGNADSLIKVGDFWSVKTKQGKIKSKVAVIALGPWGDDFLKKIGFKLPLGVKRGYHMHYRYLNQQLKHTIVDVENGFAITPMVKGIRLTTGAEFALRDSPSTPVQIEAIEPIAKKIFPLGNKIDSNFWLGSRPCTPDMLPILGSIPGNSGLWFNIGHAHHGLTQAASSGRLVAELICGIKPYINPKPYSIERFL